VNHPHIDTKAAGGFTLIEVMIAIFILVAALLGVAGLTAGIINGNSHSDRLTTATVLAQEKMEDIRRLGYAGTAASDTTTTENYNTISSHPLYRRVTFLDAASPGANMKTATVTVYWDSDGKSVQLKTVLAKEG